MRIEWEAAPPPPFHHGVSRVSAEDREWVSLERDRCLLSKVSMQGRYQPALVFFGISGLRVGSALSALCGEQVTGATRGYVRFANSVFAFPTRPLPVFLFVLC